MTKQFTIESIFSGDLINSIVSTETSDKSVRRCAISLYAGPKSTQEPTHHGKRGPT